jgi:ADP-ribosylglycohydrolase
MALHLARSLISCPAFDPSDVLSRYVDWWRQDAADSGPTAGRVLQLIANGMAPEDAVCTADREALGRTAGCNPAHRAVPLAAAPSVADDQLAVTAIAEARLTHKHPLAGDVSAAVVVLCRALIRGMSWESSLIESRVCRLPETAEALSDSQLEPRNSGGYAPDVLQAACSFVEAAPSFDAALAASLRFAGPANYCPVLVGAIAGARWGRSTINPRSLHHPMALAKFPELEAIADSLPLT